MQHVVSHVFSSQQFEFRICPSRIVHFVLRFSTVYSLGHWFFRWFWRLIEARAMYESAKMCTNESFSSICERDGNNRLNVILSRREIVRIICVILIGVFKITRRPVSKLLGSSQRTCQRSKWMNHSRGNYSCQRAAAVFSRFFSFFFLFIVEFLRFAIFAGSQTSWYAGGQPQYRQRMR